MVCDIVTENLIKGIIVAHSRTGITIKQIANEFQRLTEENWPFPNIDEKVPTLYLQQIDGILSINNEKKERVWYVRGKTLNGENRGKIYRANTQPSGFDSSNSSTWRQPHDNRPNTCTQYNNGNNNNNNNFGNGRNTKYNIGGERSNNSYMKYNVGAHYPTRYATQQKFYKNNGNTVNGHGSGLSNETDACNSPGRDGGKKMNATLYDYDLVGDDFFLELARIDLSCHISHRKGNQMGRQIRRSGLCISGQSIRDATDRLKRCPEKPNMKIIVNLGSIDILHGNDLTDMCQDYEELVKICDRRGIRVVITTLAPLANRLFCPNDTVKLRKFNEFLVKKFSDKYHVIDITPCLVDKATSKLLFGCYQAVAKYVSGSNQPHTLWNRIGRQRILKKIKTNLPV